MRFRLAAAERFERREMFASRRWTDGSEFIQLDGKHGRRSKLKRFDILDCYQHRLVAVDRAIIARQQHHPDS